MRTPRLILMVVVMTAGACLIVLSQKIYAQEVRNSDVVVVNIPTSNGGFTPVKLIKQGSGYIGPQGEYYKGNPTVQQLEVLYGNNSYTQTSLNSFSVTIAPPPLPVYVQPALPAPNYIWTPGYWAHIPLLGYYWVPGTWVVAPAVGLLWTPGYWYWRGGYYVWSEGYWGSHIGFYGGIHYGFGYDGVGFRGGHWHHGVFINKTVSVMNITNNTYNTTNNVIDNNSTTNNAASFNGGVGGTSAKPTPAEQIAAKEKHFPPTAGQKFHVQAASRNHALLASVNNGKPAIAATPRPGMFGGKGVVAAKGARILNPAVAKHTQPVILQGVAHSRTLPNGQPMLYDDKKSKKTPSSVEHKSSGESHSEDKEP